MTPYNLIEVAKSLAYSERGRPRRANLCRAVSTAYYAMLHSLAGVCADSLVGSAASNRSDPSWLQAYRALDHGTVRRRCQRLTALGRFPLEVQAFANKFVDLQEKRHTADYNPNALFAKDAVAKDIEDAERIIYNFGRAPLKDRRAFAVYVLLNVRGQ